MESARGKIKNAALDSTMDVKCRWYVEKKYTNTSTTNHSCFCLWLRYPPDEVHSAWEICGNLSIFFNQSASAPSVLVLRSHSTKFRSKSSAAFAINENFSLSVGPTCVLMCTNRWVTVEQRFHVRTLNPTIIREKNQQMSIRQGKGQGTWGGGEIIKQEDTEKRGYRIPHTDLIIPY